MKRGIVVVVMLTISTIAYAVGAVLSYVFIRGFSVYQFFFLWSLGSIIALPAVMSTMGMRNDLFSSIKKHGMSIAGAGLLAAFNFTLFLAYKSYLLAGVYSLTAAGSLVFFGIDALVYRSVLAKGKELIALLGIMLVVIGIFFAESSGARLSFNYHMLPYVLAIICTAGLGYYLMFYNMHKYSVGSKVSSAATGIPCSLHNHARTVALWNHIHTRCPCTLLNDPAQRSAVHGRALDRAKDSKND